MYYQNYEDYMRSVLGYPREAQNTYETYNYTAMPYEENSFYVSNFNVSNNSELMDLYPDIYKLIQPMVQKICEANTKPMTKELLDQMTREIYLNIESVPEIDTVINVQVTTPRESKESSKNSSSKSMSSKMTSQNRKETPEIRENKEIKESREDRQRIPNRTLEDLIRILILNQLISGGNRPPVKPPVRPPFPGGPGPRPPMSPQFPRDNRPYIDEYLKF